jgi:hypothetical protein
MGTIKRGIARNGLIQILGEPRAVATEGMKLRGQSGCGLICFNTPVDGCFESVQRRNQSSRRCLNVARTSHVHSAQRARSQAGLRGDILGEEISVGG